MGRQREVEKTEINVGRERSQKWKQEERTLRSDWTLVRNCSSTVSSSFLLGLFKKPSLSALRQPEVTSGENMILSCTSDHQFDLFHLSREGVPQGHGLPAEQSHSGTFQANFLPVPLIQAETYRCYGSFRNSSHVWSSPSDPFYLYVSGKKVVLYVSHILWLRRA